MKKIIKKLIDTMLLIDLLVFVCMFNNSYCAQAISGKAANAIDPLLAFAYNCKYASAEPRVSKDLPYCFSPISLSQIGRVISLDLSNKTPKVSVFIKFNGNTDELLAHSVNVRSKIGDIVTADLPLSQLPIVASLPSVRYIEAAKPVELHLNVSAPMVRAPEARATFGVTGKGIVVGIIDSGIDVDHLDFQHSSGTNNTRILYLWDQLNDSGDPPFGYDYGTEWRKENIDNGDCNSNNTNDRIGHGTHVAGIAAGNGRATDHGVPERTYVGMGLEADLIIVDVDLSDNSKITDGLVYVGNQAASLEKPWVANLSLGSRYGPKDGTSLFEQAVFGITNQQLGKGKVIVVSAGNDGYDSDDPNRKESCKYHAGGVGEAQSTIQVYSHPTLTDEYVWNEIWYPASDPVEITITGPNGHTYGPFGSGEGTGAFMSGSTSKIPKVLSYAIITTLMLVGLILTPLHQIIKL